MRSRRRPTLPLLLLLVLGLAVGSCADDAEIGGPRLGGASAATVGSFRYSTADLEDEVEQWASNPQFLEQVLQLTDIGEPDRRPAPLVAFVLSHRVISEQARQMAGEGTRPTAQDVEQLIAQIDGSFTDPQTGEPLFAGYGERFRQRLARDFAYQQNLQNVDPDTVEVPEVAVNPRYGSFEDQDRGLGQVVPPTGPLQAPLLAR